MARGCALIDSRLDTAKICSDKRVHVDHAQLPAVFGGEKTFSHGLGQNRKSSMRANVFCCSSNNGHRQDTSACPFRANSGTSPGAREHARQAPSELAVVQIGTRSANTGTPMSRRRSRQRAAL